MIRPTGRSRPYVGPCPLEGRERLYGRRREVVDLLDLLVADRVVLLHSPSGAGKTSLIHSGVAPALEEEGFRVRPIMRMNLPVENAFGANRYVLSVLLSQEELLPREKQTPIDQLAKMSISEYLGKAAARECILFDQLEDVLVGDPTDCDAKEAFFSQVGEALAERSRWALFAIREDQDAGLRQYSRFIPGHLGTKFRLDFLGEEAAYEAIKLSARDAGVDFTDGAVSEALRRLRQVRVQRPDGAVEQRLGPHIEPLHLQTMCLRLWDQLPADTSAIVEQHVEALGDWDDLLAVYYSEVMERIASGNGSSQRALRAWIDRYLISASGTRAQVIGGEGLDAGTINALVDSRLVRADRTRDIKWFELAHDRLIDPVRRDNVAWGEVNLRGFQRRAALWNNQARPGRLLLQGQALLRAKSWASKHADEVTPIEQEFLAACSETQSLGDPWRATPTRHQRSVG